MPTKVEEHCSAKIHQNPASLQFANSSVNKEKNLNAQSDENLPRNSSIIVGTYQIPENGPVGSLKRLGGLYLIDCDSFEVQQKNCEAFEADGVFRFEQNAEDGRIVTALSSGELGIFEVNAPQINPISKIWLTKNMLLDCKSSFRLGNDEEFVGRTICTDSAGHLFLVDLRSQSLITSLRAHRMLINFEGANAVQYGWKDGSMGGDCEAWSCAWIDQMICATGAEDACLKIWDFRCIDSSPHPVPALSIKRAHSAGITRIHLLPDHFLLTGSYDEHLRIFDTRKLAEGPICELKMPGGVWDLNPVGEECLIAACMYGGWSLIRLCPRLHSLQLLHSQSSNGHLLYGVDAIAGENSSYLVASCTFDDSQIRLQRLFI